MADLVEVDEEAVLLEVVVVMDVLVFGSDRCDYGHCGGGRWRKNYCGGGCGLGLPVGCRGKVFNERPHPHRYVPSTRLRSSSLKDNLLIFWTTPSKVELIP